MTTQPIATLHLSSQFYPLSQHPSPTDTILSAFQLSHLYDATDFTLHDSQNYSCRFLTGNYDNYKRISISEYTNQNAEFPVKHLVDVYQELISRQMFVACVGMGAFRVKARNQCIAPLNLENFCQFEFERCIRVDAQDAASLEYSELAYDFGNFDVVPLNDSDQDATTEWMCVMTQRDAMRIRVKNTHSDPIALFVTLNEHAFIQSKEQSYVVVQPNAILCLEGIMRDEGRQRLHQLVTCPVESDTDMILNIEVWPLKKRNFGAYEKSPIIADQTNLDVWSVFSQLPVSNNVYIQSQELCGTEEILLLEHLSEALSQEPTSGSLTLVPHFMFVHVKIDSVHKTQTLKIPLPNQEQRGLSNVLQDLSLELVLLYICEQLDLNLSDYSVAVNDEPTPSDSQRSITHGTVIRLTTLPAQEPEQHFFRIAQETRVLKTPPVVKKALEKIATDTLQHHKEMTIEGFATTTSLASCPPTTAGAYGLFEYDEDEDFPMFQHTSFLEMTSSVMRSDSRQTIASPSARRIVSSMRKRESIRRKDSELVMSMMENDVSEPVRKGGFPVFGQYHNASALHGAALKIQKHPLERGLDSHTQDDWDLVHRLKCSVLIKNSIQWKKMNRDKPSTPISLGMYSAIGLRVPPVLASERYIREEDE